MAETNLVTIAIDKIDKWLKATDMPATRLGLLACANARAVERVKAGGGSVDTLRAILEYIDSHPAKGERK